MDKEEFIVYVNDKIKHLSKKDVRGVIFILIEEIIKDLKENKELKIHNFCSIKLRKPSNHKIWNYFIQDIAHPKRSRVLKFTLLKILKKYIKDNLDFEKTFNK